MALIVFYALKGRCMFTDVALQGAQAKGYGKKEIIECIKDYIDVGDFVKTMRSEKYPGTMQDVYRCQYKNIDWYVKICFFEDRKEVLVISFKEHGSVLPKVPIVRRKRPKVHRPRQNRNARSETGHSKS